MLKYKVALLQEVESMKGEESSNSGEYNGAPQQFPSYPSTVCWVLEKIQVGPTLSSPPGGKFIVA